MTKIKIDTDEWYPVYTIGNRRHSKEIDLPDELIERLRNTTEAFEQVQDEIYKLMHHEDRPD